ncbi:hypothetical protein GE21DRAFT_1042171 [Neurospora crassa]|nr:hypothetical protein GE21DRAFT_1042171 [Neurospora crassa]
MTSRSLVHISVVFFEAGIVCLRLQVINIRKKLEGKKEKKSNKEKKRGGKNPGGKATDNCCKYTRNINAHDPIYFTNNPMVSRPRGLESALS